MKTAIYVEDGKVQVVITPENVFERQVLLMLNGTHGPAVDLDAKIFRGQFYDCRGGWVRQRDVPISSIQSDSEMSLIVSVRNLPAPGKPSIDRMPVTASI